MSEQERDEQATRSFRLQAEGQTGSFSRQGEGQTGSFRLQAEGQPGGPEPAAPRRVSWFRSLYWRIALGFVAMLAVVLLLQTALFLWLTGRFTESSSSRTPQELA